MTTPSAHVRLFAALATSFVLATLGRVAAQSPPSLDVERGHHLATALAGCADCHGATFAGGRAFVRGDQTVYAANLTGGAGGIGGYSDADLRRAIRTGVRPDGTHLRVMPVSEYAVLTDSDVDDLIAFLRALQPVDRGVPRSAPTSSGATQGASPLAQTAMTPQDVNAAPAPAPTGGAYLATIGGCTNCHGANLAGATRPGGIVAPNISHDGIGTWTFSDFQTAMRTGKTPAGRSLSTAMPWETIGKMTDAELRAVYDYLESQPARAKERGVRDSSRLPATNRSRLGFAQAARRSVSG